MAKKLPKGSNLSKFQSVGGPYAEMICKCCDKPGCLIPVLHGKRAMGAAPGAVGSPKSGLAGSTPAAPAIP
jgi:hypothetical protein